MTDHPSARNPGTRIVPKTILPVTDAGRAADFYAGLGFEVVNYDETYAWVRHRGAELLHLATVTSGFDLSTNGAAIYLHVEDADAWHEAWSSGDRELTAIEDRPWGMREFSLLDPDRNLIRVGHNL